MRLTRTEEKNKKLTKNNLQKAVSLISEMGIVTIESVLSKIWCQKMNNAWLGVLDRGDTMRPSNEDTWKQLLDFPFIDPLAIENPWGIQIIREVLGNNFWGFLPYHTNTNWPDNKFTDEFLWVHRDQGQFFPELKIPQPPLWMIMHITLVDFTDENGSTEVWPGSHHIIDPNPLEVRIGPIGKNMDHRVSRMPSKRLNVPAGSLIIRDMRLCHRATINESEEPRCMLSFVYKSEKLGIDIWDGFGPFPNFNKFGPLPKFLKNKLSNNAQQIYRFVKYPKHIKPIFDQEALTKDEKKRINLIRVLSVLSNLGYDKTNANKGIKRLITLYKNQNLDLAEAHVIELVDKAVRLIK